MINGPILVTERLILRPPSGDDLPAFVRFSSDEETTRFIGGVMNEAEAWRAWAALAGAWHIRGFSMFSLICRDTGNWVGRIGPWQPEGWPGKEIGWGVAPEYAGKGYAFEAAKACMDYVFDLLGWDDVIHTIAPDNIASIKLAERLGSHNLGPTALPSPYDHYRVDKYGQTRAEWKAQHS